MINANSFNGSNQVDSYTDLANLHSITELGRTDKNQALGKVAEQFESMMVRMMMKSMREANSVFSEGNMFSSNEGDMYQDMFDDQIALSLSSGRGLGVAEVMIRQLQSRFGVEGSKPKTGEFQDYLTNRNGASGEVSGLVAAQYQAEKAASEDTINAMHFDGKPANFVREIYKVALETANKLGIDPEVLIAQSALETGWGQKITAMGDKQSLNFFNIKADARWQGQSITVATMEVKNGLPVREKASFRAYENAEQSFKDYAEFVGNSPRYREALDSNDSETYIKKLKEAGYATDPNYAEKIISIMNSEDVKQAIAVQRKRLI